MVATHLTSMHCGGREGGELHTASIISGEMSEASEHEVVIISVGKI